MMPHVDQDSNLRLKKQQASVNSRKVLRSIWYIAGAGLIGLLGFGLFKGVTTSSRIDAATHARYQDYIDNCQVFLERSNTAGTAGVTRSELARAIHSLDSHYPQNSFEFRDLKANLAALETQPANSEVPISIKSSIRDNTESLQKTEKAKLTYHLSHLIVISSVILGMPTCLIIMIICSGSSADTKSAL